MAPPLAVRRQLPERVVRQRVAGRRAAHGGGDRHGLAGPIVGVAVAAVQRLRRRGVAGRDLRQPAGGVVLQRLGHVAGVGGAHRQVVPVVGEVRGIGAVVHDGNTPDAVQIAQHAAARDGVADGAALAVAQAAAGRREVARVGVAGADHPVGRIVGEAVGEAAARVALQQVPVRVVAPGLAVGERRRVVVGGLAGGGAVLAVVAQRGGAAAEVGPIGGVARRVVAEGLAVGAAGRIRVALIYLAGHELVHQVVAVEGDVAVGVLLAHRVPRQAVAERAGEGGVARVGHAVRLGQVQRVVGARLHAGGGDAIAAGDAGQVAGRVVPVVQVLVGGVHRVGAPAGRVVLIAGLVAQRVAHAEQVGGAVDHVGGAADRVGVAHQPPQRVVAQVVDGHVAVTVPRHVAVAIVGVGRLRRRLVARDGALYRDVGQRGQVRPAQVVVVVVQGAIPGGRPLVVGGGHRGQAAIAVVGVAGDHPRGAGRAVQRGGDLRRGAAGSVAVDTVPPARGESEPRVVVGDHRRGGEAGGVRHAHAAPVGAAGQLAVAVVDVEAPAPVVGRPGPRAHQLRHAGHAVVGVVAVEAVPAGVVVALGQIIGRGVVREVGHRSGKRSAGVAGVDLGIVDLSG